MLGSSVTQVFHINKSESIRPDALVPLTTVSVHDIYDDATVENCGFQESLSLDLFLLLLFV